MNEGMTVPENNLVTEGEQDKAQEQYNRNAN
jgi:hypothetical protein